MLFGIRGQHRPSREFIIGVFIRGGRTGIYIIRGRGQHFSSREFMMGVVILGGRSENYIIRDERTTCDLTGIYNIGYYSGWEGDF